MPNKIILALLVTGLFICAAIAGYYGPDWIKQSEQKKEAREFVAGAVPKRQYDAFAAQFAVVAKATEPKYLPDEGLKDVKGNDVRFKDFAGKPTLVNLWASWCTPCMVEMPSLLKFKEHYAAQLNVVAISVEDTMKPAMVGNLLEKRQLTGLTGYVDTAGNFMKMGLRGIPTSFLIGSNGQILYRLEGDADWSGPETQEFFDVFLLQNR